MMDWIVRAALRVHPKIEKAKYRKIHRFHAPMQSVKGNLKNLLASAEGWEFEDDDGDEQLKAAKTKLKEKRWEKYCREEAMTAPGKRDLCSIF